MSAQFDQTNPADIERYGKRLLGTTLRKEPGVLAVPPEFIETAIGGRTRGAFGTILERYYYGINPGNESAPDFPEAGVELKSTPLKKLIKGGFSAKERLVLNIINYAKEAEIPSFESSSFLRKNATIMLISYEHEDGRPAVDHPVRIAQLLKFSELPEKDRLIIENDWKRIVSKIRDRKAHELHEGETEYLSACTKAANSSIERTQVAGGPPAKPRAFSFKAGYMTVLLRQMLEPGEAAKEYESAVSATDLAQNTFEEEIVSRFSPFVGKSVKEITEKVGEGLNPASKDYYAMLARRMIGVKGRKIEEFEKAEIVMKSIQLRADGMPKEDMSFPAFRMPELIQEDWEAADEGDTLPPSTFKAQLQKRFLFVVYQCGTDCNKQDERKLLKAFFWTMPTDALESEVRRVWQLTLDAIKHSDPTSFPKKSGSAISHIRPHGRNAQDTDTLPDGTQTPKRCFWLDKRFIRQQVIKSA